MEPRTLWDVFDEESRSDVVHACSGEHCQVCRRASLPYAGTSGWSGSETSRSRAVTDDRSGVTAKRQANVLQILGDSEFHGVTWKELSDLTGEHHGSTSGALSVLHKDGIIARLTETRNRCKVYVLPEYVDGREIEPHGRTKAKECPNCGHEL